jgi:hypothetical protein
VHNAVIDGKGFQNPARDPILISPSLEEGTLLMSAASVSIPRHHSDDLLWKLVSATSVETRDVATTIPARPSAQELLADGVNIVHQTLRARNGFRLLSRRQREVLQRLQTANFGEWTRSDCKQFAMLLDEIVLDETAVLKLASDAPGAVQRVWGKQTLRELSTQVSALRDYAHHLDALTVHISRMPGDEEMQEFLSTLASPEEFDFSLD